MLVARTTRCKEPYTRLIAGQDRTPLSLRAAVGGPLVSDPVLGWAIPQTALLPLQATSGHLSAQLAT